ncbi:MAG: hypothetical protein ETSY2_36455 [Candidatus Entotheonella gemina]|uniref:Uncharacterized protein n=1 Tax=Candidatus Entotheonella gemina TaxID=1429439 RepID=W4LVK4_9BACT|nr:MAG: hypothetical protein ETSY2_36455 [Candidatus Entotheonella gemina]
MLKKSDDPYKSLLAYRSTPLQLGYSPSQLLMGRILRTTVPTTRAQREPHIPDLSLVRSRDKTNKARQKKNFHHGARDCCQVIKCGSPRGSAKERCRRRLHQDRILLRQKMAQFVRTDMI